VLDAISLTGVQAGLARFDVAAHNVANLLTPGFKASRLDQVTLRGGGTALSGRTVDFSSGPLELTEEGFALAIQGGGFFQVESPRGARFTRDGAFRVDAAGNLVTSDGLPVTPSVRIPGEAVSILVTRDGQVLALFGDGTFQQVGQVGIADFSNPGGLLQEEGNLFAATAASGPPLPGAAGGILFGALEGSNAGLVAESIDAAFAQASVRANLSALQAEDEILGELLDILG